MKRFSIVILLSFLGTFVCFAQNVSDSVFTNVVKIEDKNITKYGDKMPIDVSIPTDIEVPIIFFDISIKNKIPRNLLLELYFYEYNVIMFIAPNWESSIGENNIKTFTIYKLDRGRGENRRLNGQWLGPLLDSLNLQKNFLELHFADMKLKDEEVDIYYQVGYGSRCCPRDKNWDNYESNQEFLKKYIDKIGDGYRIVLGREGEHITYYTLAGTAQEKLKFLADSFSETPPRIYTPFRQNITGAKKIKF